MTVVLLAALAIDLTKPDLSVASGHLNMGGANPQGVEIAVNSRYLTMAGKPWFPVMGEFHFSRSPRECWETELLKMKAGGITVVSTYVFWIHHEEIEGEFDWSGRRDLRAFVELCGKHGLYCYPRIGPWAHGEARNGGFPDWLLQKCGRNVRRDAEPYLTYVRRFYGETSRQLRGLLWKDGGPVIGTQLENELTRDPGHILTLKNLARELGLDVPLYSMTGWMRAQVPAGEVLPVFGGYPDAFWVKQTTDWARESRQHYFFGLERDDSTIGADLQKKPGMPDTSFLTNYPFATCELGGGMQVSYRRRPAIEADDIAALSLTKVGSGSNLQGYYMFHGGSNPSGKLSTLNESRATGYPNDLPVINYDFQAPLGEYGQRRPAYDKLRRLHLFLNDFGSELAPWPAVMPEKQPASLDDTNTLRWAARSDGRRGFLFINNYQRIEPLPDHTNVVFELKLKNETIRLPVARIPSGASMIWPFNLGRLKYATAQPLCRLADCTVFFATDGVPPVFVFDDGQTLRPKPGLFRSHGMSFLLLSPEQARQAWKHGDRLFLSNDQLIFEGDKLRLLSRRPNMSFAVYPPANFGLNGRKDGVFTRYDCSVPARTLRVQWKQIQPPKPTEPNPDALAPDDPAFEAAGIWEVRVPREGFLKIDYVGDVARLYVGDRLVADDFYFGRVWEVGLKRLGADRLTLKILPLRKDAPIYLPRDRRPQFDDDEAVGVRDISAEPEYEIVVRRR